MLPTLQVYLPTLLLTLVLELAIAAALAPRALRRRTLTTCAALNLVTHPLATLALGVWTTGWLPLEVTVTVAEAFGYRAVVPLGAARAWGLALLANAVTAFGALLWSALLQ